MFGPSWLSFRQIDHCGIREDDVLMRYDKTVDVTPVASQNRCFCHALKLLIACQMYAGQLVVGLGQSRRPLSPTLAESWQDRIERDGFYAVMKAFQFLHRG